MRIKLDVHVFGPLLAACLLLSTAAIAAPPPGKGNDKGGEEDPPTTPVDYQLELIPAEGLRGIDAVNDVHQGIGEVKVAEVTLQPINSQALYSTAVIDLDTGTVSYIDNLLTEPTPWTVLSEGVYDALFTAIDINNHGDIVGVASYYVTPDRSQFEYEGFLLSRDSDSYQPISFGRTLWPWKINDLGDIAFREAEYDQGVYQEIVGAAFLPAGATQIQYFNDAIEVADMNLWGQILCNRGVFDYFIWNPDGTIQNLPDLKIADDINDWGVVSGQVEVVTEYKERGKIKTRTDRVPATWTETGGVKLLAGGDFVSQSGTQSVVINNQIINGECAVAASVTSGDIWLQLPQQDGFYVSNAMTSADYELFQTIRSDNSPIAFPTPLLPDATVAHAAFPILTGRGSLGGQVWVLRPVPSTSAQ